MSIEQLDIDTNAIITAKLERLSLRQEKTPSAAVIALADMQSLPHPILNVVTNGESVTVIGQITYTEVYDPVGVALRYRRAGAQAAAFLTDQQVYYQGLEDMLLVARGVELPVVCQDFILNEYHVAEARAAGAAALTLYASILDAADLRRTVSITQRWRMSAIVQIENATQLAQVRSLSPHVVSVGKPLSFDIDADLATLANLRSQIPHNTQVMLLNRLPTLEHVAAALRLRVDAIVVDEMLLSTPEKKLQLFEMLGHKR